MNNITKISDHPDHYQHRRMVDIDKILDILYLASISSREKDEERAKVLYGVWQWLDNYVDNMLEINVAPKNQGEN